MNNYNNNYYLNCTKEVTYCLEEAKRIARLKNPKHILQPIHLCLSLLFNSKLIQKVLNINPYRLNKKNIINIIFNDNLIDIDELTFKKTSLYCNIDKNILVILNILNTLKYPFNTLLLFYYLWKQNSTLVSFLLSILKLNNINYNFFLVGNYITNLSSTINIPIALKDILKPLKRNHAVLGREKEIKKIIEILVRSLNRNVILLGDAGIGKSSIVKSLISLMPNKFFLELNILNLIVQHNNINYIKTFFYFLEKQKEIVLFCKNFHLLFDSSTSELNYIKNTLYKLLNANKIQIIGTSSIVYYEKIIQHEEQLKFLFSKIFVTEPEKYITLLIMKQYLAANNIYLIKHHTLETIIELSNKFITNYVFPKKGLLILDSLITKFKNSLNEKTMTRDEILTSIAQYSELPTTLIIKETTTSNNINNIDLNLKKYVFGQDLAIMKITASLKRAYTGLKDKNKPIGSWLLCGPSGTGKTELVKALAYLLFGSEKELIRFDMSEFMEKHSISKLIGSPPGYVGCEEGGLLTEAVKKNPYSVILFDEIEKAHKDINNIMLQLLDEGTLTDSKGQHVDFTNTLIIYTSNLGCPTSPVQFKSFQNGIELSEEEYKFLTKNVDTAIKQFFRPEFLNRLDSVVVFKPLSILCLTHVIDKFIVNLLKKLRENNILLQIEIEQEIKILLAKLAYHPLYGARPLKRIIEQFIEKPISELLINFKFTTPHLFSIYKDKEKETINYLVQKIQN